MAGTLRSASLKVTLLLTLGASAPALAYECLPVRSSSPSVTQAWVSRCIPYVIHRGGELFSGEERRALIAQSFEQWASTRNPCTDLEFPNFGYTDARPGFDPAGKNENVLIAFTDPADVDQFFESSGLLAITLNTFSTKTGEIFDADILFNQARFEFAEIGDDAACRQASPAPYDLGNTLVHEIGHLLGFEHNTNQGSTMFGSAAACETKKRSLNADDVQGVCDVYPVGQPTKTCRPPADYDATGGKPQRFRDQCNGGGEDAMGECACIAVNDESDLGASLSWGLALLGIIAVRGRRRTYR